MGSSDDRAARPRAPPRRRRSPSRSDPRTASRRAGGGRSGTRRRRRSRRPPSRRTRGRRPSRIEAGSCSPASRYIASRQDQKSSAACASGAGPLGRAAQVALERVRVRVDHRRQLVGRHASALQRGRGSGGRRHGGVLELDVLLGRVADAGRRCGRTPCRPGSAGRGCRRRGRRSRRAPAGRPSRRARRGRSRRPSVCEAVREPDLDAGGAGQLGGAGGERVAPGRRARSSSGVRPSIHSRTPDGTVVNAFGSTSMRAAVTRKSGSPPASSSAATISRAAAASASRRSSRRVVPAWSARPANVSASRIRDASAAHRAGRRAEPLEVLRLVDVQLDEAAQPRQPRRRVGERVRVGAGGAHRVGERDAVVVARGRARRRRRAARPARASRTSAC